MSDTAKVKKPRTMVGRVVSDRMQKTVVVMMQRSVRHPKYAKYVNRRSKIFAHDENNICKIGDRVEIQEYRPLSKQKSWILVKVLTESVVQTDL